MMENTRNKPESEISEKSLFLSLSSLSLFLYNKARDDYLSDSIFKICNYAWVITEKTFGAGLLEEDYRPILHYGPHCDFFLDAQKRFFDTILTQ